MKSLAAFALAVLSCVPAMAQFGGLGQGRPGFPQMPSSPEAEFLEMEQEADKAALKEALLLQARQGMKPAPDSEPEQKRYVEEIARLREFIDKKKDAITARSAELTKRRVANAAPAGRPAQIDRKAALENAENARVEVQLLEAKLRLLQEPLSKAIEELAAAELAASADETRRDKAVAARKEYDKIKAMHVEQSKLLRLEQQQASGMLGGMGGMGGQGMF